MHSAAAEADAIDPLINILSSKRDGAIANAATVLTNMAIQEPLRSIIQGHDVMQALLAPLHSTNTVVQSTAALTVASTACDVEARNQVRLDCYTICSHSVCSDRYPNLLYLSSFLWARFLPTRLRGVQLATGYFFFNLLLCCAGSWKCDKQRQCCNHAIVCLQRGLPSLGHCQRFFPAFPPPHTNPLACDPPYIIARSFWVKREAGRLYIQNSCMTCTCCPTAQATGFPRTPQHRNTRCPCQCALLFYLLRFSEWKGSLLFYPPGKFLYPFKANSTTSSTGLSPALQLGWTNPCPLLLLPMSFLVFLSTFYGS